MTMAKHSRTKMRVLRTLTVLIAAAIFSGCASQDKTMPEPTVTSPSPAASIAYQPEHYVGVTGMTACVSGPGVLNCPVADNGSGVHEFKCEKGALVAFEGNVTWNNTGPTQPEFTIQPVFYDEGQRHWNTTQPAKVTTSSPQRVAQVTTNTTGYRLGLYVFDVYRGDAAGAGPVASKGDSFEFTGFLSCERANT